MHGPILEQTADFQRIMMIQEHLRICTIHLVIVVPPTALRIWSQFERWHVYVTTQQLMYFIRGRYPVSL
jgi:hypothetical protein